jgi:hypothetical protein
VLDKLTGKLADTIAMARPAALAAAQLGNAMVLWVIESNGSNASHPQWVVVQYRSVSYMAPDYLDNGTYVKTQLVLPGVINPAAISAIPTINRGSGRSGGALAQGGLVVADAGDTTLKIFDSNGKLINTIGHAGGYSDGNPTVVADRFMWNSVSGGASQTVVSVAADDAGAVWVTDVGNRRVYGARFQTHAFSLEDAIGSHASSLA